MIWICILYWGLLGVYMLVLIFLISWKKDQALSLPIELPNISILVAARNEEHNIENCLRALTQLHYPKEKIEILVGNDDSQDNTEQLIRNYSSEHSQISLHNISKTIGLAKGKANVLAQLAQKAKGDFFFITDADIQVPPNWIPSLLEHFTNKTGIVSGCTYSKPSSFLGKAQQLDWLFAFGMVHVVSDLNIPVSAVGNNMAIRKEAYLSTGGYEKIPFSVTEDQELFIHTLKNGWGFKNLFNPHCLAITEPISSWGALLKQRRRWMSGAMKIPMVLLLCLFLQGIAFPAVLITLWLNPLVGIMAWAGKSILQQVFLWRCFKRVALPYSFLRHSWLFEFYSMILSPIVVVQYFFVKKIEWKGRSY